MLRLHQAIRTAHRMSQAAAAATLDPRKFRDPKITARGEARAHVPLRALETLWVNTGTLCNLTCRNCYIESSPRNDRLTYLSRAELREYLAEIARDGLPTRQIGFTGGEPFMNPDLLGMLDDALAAGLAVLVLTNAMTPMRKQRAGLLRLRAEHGDRLRLRVSVDHYAARVHEAERGRRSWAPTLDGLVWLARHGFALDVAGRLLSGEPEAQVRAGFARLFAEHAIPIDAADPVRLMLFPEMDATRDVPEITEACWGILHKSPDSVMCASSRMVVKRNGAERPAVLACTLLAYDERFELGATLAEASRPVALNHPHCASFCVLGGAACSR
jgi:pyruvate-formate lyase-activating enzyme